MISTRLVLSMGGAMRRFLLAAVMIGTASCAQAADMPDLPILRGSYVDGLTTSRVNWQGFYVGGQGGYGSSDEKFAGSNASMLATLLDHNVIQQMQVSQWNLGLAGQSARSSAYGAFAGYNWQWDDVVVGLEVSYMHGSFGERLARPRNSSAARRCSTDSSTTLPSIHRHQFRFRTWQPFVRAPLTHGAASFPTCSADLRSAKPTSHAP